jgi:hypothetical protein
MPATSPLEETSGHHCFRRHCCPHSYYRRCPPVAAQFQCRLCRLAEVSCQYRLCRLAEASCQYRLCRLAEASCQYRLCRWVEASCYQAEVSCWDRRYPLGSDRLEQFRCFLLHHRMQSGSAPDTGSEQTSTSFVVT